jgi:hypothetical protein
MSISMAAPVTKGLSRTISYSTLNEQSAVSKSGSVVWNSETKHEDPATKENTAPAAHLTRNNSMYLGNSSDTYQRQGTGSYSWGEPGKENYFQGNFDKNKVSGIGEVYSKETYNGASFTFYAKGNLREGTLDSSDRNTLTVIFKKDSNSKSLKITFSLQELNELEFKENFPDFKKSFISKLMSNNSLTGNYIERIVNVATMQTHRLSENQHKYLKKGPLSRFNEIKQRVDSTSQQFLNLRYSNAV